MRTNSAPLSFADLPTNRNVRIRDDVLLQRIVEIVDWSFTEKIHEKLYQATVGRKPYDTTRMIRIIFLQQLYGLSDAQVEERMYDSRSAERFTKSSANDPIPDETSICRFRNRLVEMKLDKVIFNEVQQQLKENGCVIHKGRIIDATIFELPKGRKKDDGTNTRDVSASFTKKNNRTYHGFKGHTASDIHGEFIQKVFVSTASDHDSIHSDKILDGTEPVVLGDSAYINKKKKRKMKDEGRFYGIVERATRGHPLSTKQKKRNHKLSRIRVKVEHPYAEIKCRMFFKGRYRSLEKNAWHFSMVCSVYNIKRMVGKLFKPQKQAVIQCPVYSI